MSLKDNQQLNQQNSQLNQDLKQQPYQQNNPQQNQQQQANTSVIITQQINYDQKNLQQPQQQYQYTQQFYQQPQQQYYNPQQQMYPQQYQQQYQAQQNYQSPQIEAQYVNNDANNRQPIQYIPQGQPQIMKNQVAPMYYQQPTIIDIQPQNIPGVIINITDNTLRSADGYRFPTTIICPTCNVKGQTIIRHESSDVKHIVALILCLFCPPLCFVPYLVQDGDNIQHYCLTCKSKAGIKAYRICDSY